MFKLLNEVLSEPDEKVIILIAKITDYENPLTKRYFGC